MDVDFTIMYMCGGCKRENNAKSRERHKGGKAYRGEGKDFTTKNAKAESCFNYFWKS